MRKKFFVPILKLPPGILNGVTDKTDCMRGDANECWPTLLRTSGGYGVVKLPKEYGGRSIGAHRIAYAAANPDKFRDDLPVRGMCQMRGCVNPAHHYQRGMVGKYAGKRVYAKTKLTQAGVRTIKKWIDALGPETLAQIYHIDVKEVRRIAKLR